MSGNSFLKEALKKYLLKHTFILSFLSTFHIYFLSSPSAQLLKHWVIILASHSKSFLSNLQQHLLPYFHGHRLTFHYINNLDQFYLASNLNPLTWQKYCMLASLSKHQRRSLHWHWVSAFFLCDSLTPTKPSRPTFSFFEFLLNRWDQQVPFFVGGDNVSTPLPK